MRRMAIAAFVGAVVLAGQGCRTRGCPETAVRSAEPVALPPDVACPVPRAAAAARHPHARVVSAVAEPVRVLVRSFADGEAAAQVARRVEERMRGALAAAGYRAVTDGAAELVANLGVTCGPLTGDGQEGGLRCSVEAAVARSPELNDFSAPVRSDPVVTKRFGATGAPELDAEEAVGVLADRLCDQVPDWLAGACRRLGDLEVCVVTLSDARFADARTDYPTYFVQRLRGVGGVYACKILSSDVANNVLVARVVCERGRFPGGLAKRLHEMPELNIRR